MFTRYRAVECFLVIMGKTDFSMDSPLWNGIQKVHLASNPILDAWHGAWSWALENMNQEEGWITRKDYEEKGGEYLKEHCASNIYVPIRLPKQALRTTEAPTPSKSLGTAPNSASEQA